MMTKSISPVVLGEIVEKRKLTPERDSGSCSGKLRSISDAGAMDRAIRRHSSRA